MSCHICGEYSGASNLCEFHVNEKTQKDIKIANKQLLALIIEKTNDLKYTLSVDTDIDITPTWKIEEICELLYKLENEL